MVEIKPPTVNNFFYFFNLIMGNIVVGCIHIGIGVIIILIYFYLLIFNKSTSVEVENMEITLHKENYDSFTDTFDIIIRLIILVVAVFFSFISFWHVHGIRTCDPSKMKPYLFFTGTFVFLGCCAAVVTLNFFTLVIAILELYFFVCAYSLYLSLMNDPNIQQDVMFKNPSAYGYEQAIESDAYPNGGAHYYPQQQQQQQQQPDGYYDQQEGQWDEHGGQKQQGQYYNGQ